MKLLIQGTAQCFLHSVCYLFEERLLPKHLLSWQLAVPLSPTGQKKLVAQFGLCQVRDSSGPTGTRGDRVLQSCHQHPQVFFCTLCQLAWRILFFLFYISLVDVQSSRKKRLKFCQRQCRMCRRSTQAHRTAVGWEQSRLVHTPFNSKLPNSCKQMFILKSIFSLCYSNLEILPSHREVPHLHGSIRAGEKAAGWATASFFSLQPAVIVNIQQVPLAEGYQNSPAASSPSCAGLFPQDLLGKCF